MTIRHLQENENLQDIFASDDKPVLVAFWAPWCGPCRMLAPELDKLAEELEDKATVLKINIDDHQALASQDYKVMGVPTTLLIKNGKEEARLVGYRPKDSIMNAIEKFL